MSFNTMSVQFDPISQFWLVLSKEKSEYTATKFSICGISSNCKIKTPRDDDL